MFFFAKKNVGTPRPPLGPPRGAQKKNPKNGQKHPFLKTQWGGIPKFDRKSKWNTFWWRMKLVFQCVLEKKFPPLNVGGVKNQNGTTRRLYILYKYIFS